jgi:hypothetical protein
LMSSSYLRTSGERPFFLTNSTRIISRQRLMLLRISCKHPYLEQWL